ncbi:hypothetical protein H6G36_29255 [Anabaena minutissima FACHB-250]|nr:hypothetical protein [Anabaena minutissima FACHB-250]
MGFVIAANSLFLDTISTAQNLTWVMDWVRTSEIDKYVNQLFAKVETFVDVMGFWFVFLPIAFFVWRNHARN